MTKKLLNILFLMFSVGLVAQTVNTVTIDWGFGSNPSATGDSNASRTIEVGDTVTWVWNSNNHNVVSNSGANESFNSGATENVGATFSHTFILEGASDYLCTPHPNDMYGTITVVAEGALSTSETKRKV